MWPPAIRVRAQTPTQTIAARSPNQKQQRYPYPYVNIFNYLNPGSNLHAPKVIRLDHKAAALAAGFDAARGERIVTLDGDL